MSSPSLVPKPFVRSLKSSTTASISCWPGMKISTSPRPCVTQALLVRQHTSAFVSIRQHSSAYVSIRQHTSAEALIDRLCERSTSWRLTHLLCVSICTSVPVKQVLLYQQQQPRRPLARSALSHLLCVSMCTSVPASTFVPAAAASSTAGAISARVCI